MSYYVDRLDIRFAVVLTSHVGEWVVAITQKPRDGVAVASCYLEEYKEAEDEFDRLEDEATSSGWEPGDATVDFAWPARPKVCPYVVDAGKGQAVSLGFPLSYKGVEVLSVGEIPSKLYEELQVLSRKIGPVGMTLFPADYHLV